VSTILQSDVHFKTPDSNFQMHLQQRNKIPSENNRVEWSGLWSGGNRRIQSNTRRQSETSNTAIYSQTQPTYTCCTL